MEGKKGYIMKNISLEELLEAGCHFGHQVNRRNPKADIFIFETRSNINIIDLEKTREGLLKAAEYLANLASKNGYLVIVGTKRQAQSIIKEEVERAQNEGASGMFYVISRWVGGTLTNFEEVTKNFKKLKDLREFLASGKTQEYTKKEVLLFDKEKQKLEHLYEGIANMDRIPDALFIVDTHLEQTAVSEALKKELKTVGIVDTNSNPQPIDYPIPANDDAVGSIKVIIKFLVDAWIEGQKKAQSAKIKSQSELSNPIQSDLKVKNDNEKPADSEKKIEEVNKTEEKIEKKVKKVENKRPRSTSKPKKDLKKTSNLGEDKK